MLSQMRTHIKPWWQQTLCQHLQQCLASKIGIPLTEIGGRYLSVAKLLGLALDTNERAHFAL
jgi:hypothetical protein